MSNLGWYQIMTTAAKKVGGPKNLLLLVAGSGYVLFRSAEAGLKKIAKVVKCSKDNQPKLNGKTYEITSNGEDDKGLQFKVSDTFRVLEQDSDAILIEKIGDENNPYFTSHGFLKSVSDFDLAEE